MPQVQKQKLSGSTDGRQIKVTTTATPGNLIHTAQTGTTVGKFDEVWLYATNTSASDALLTIELGGVTSPDDRINVTIPFNAGRFLVVDGAILQNGVVVRAFCNGGANLINVSGHVNSVIVA